MEFFAPYVYKDYSKNGEIVYTDDLASPDYNYPQWEWYKIGTTAKVPVVWSEPYVDTATNVAMVTSTATFYDSNGKFWGVATGDIDLTSLQKLIAQIQVGDSGYAFLIDKAGTYLAVQDAAKLMKVKISEEADSALAALGQQLLAQESGETTFADAEGLNNVYYRTIPGTGWKLAFVINQQEVLKPVTDMTYIVVPLMLAAILLVAGLIWLNSRYNSRKLQQIKECITAMAEGDLSRPFQADGRDEFAQIGVQLNNTREQMGGILSRASQNAEQVAATSQQLAASVEENSRATEQITSSIQVIAAGAENQQHISHQSVKSVSAIATRLGTISGHARQVTHAVEAAMETANAGDAVVKNAVTQMNTIGQKVKISSEAVDLLDTKSAEINQITSLITSISSQTNLLALNAAIEAARAGEYGRGFAVVAEEVRKLAEQSGEAASQISVLVEQIHQGIGTAVQAMNDGTDAVKAGKDLVDQAGESFKQIASAVREVVEQSREVSVAITDIQESSRSMTNMSEELAQISNEAANNTQQAAASTEEQTASMEEIASSAHMLSHMANELQDAIRVFRCG